MSARVSTGPAQGGPDLAWRDGSDAGCLHEARDAGADRLHRLHLLRALRVAAMQITGIGRVVYAAALADSARVLAGVPADKRRKGDVAALRREAGLPIGQGRIPARLALVAEAITVLERWAKTAG